MNKTKIIYEISDLLDTHCNKCKINPYKSNQVRKRMDFCNNKCEIGKQIQKLGKRIENPNKELKELPLTKEDYIKLRDSGFTDNQVAEDSNIDNNKLLKMKKEWGLISTSESGKDDKFDNIDKNKKKNTTMISDFITRYEENEQALLTCKEEIDQLKNENNLLTNKVESLKKLSEQKSDEIISLKQKVNEINKSNIEISKPDKIVKIPKLLQENKAMKALIRVWLEEELT